MYIFLSLVKRCKDDVKRKFLSKHTNTSWCWTEIYYSLYLKRPFGLDTKEITNQKLCRSRLRQCSYLIKYTILGSFKEFAGEMWEITILTFQIGEVCLLPNWFIPSSKETCLFLLNIILQNFIKIGQRLF